MRTLSEIIIATTPNYGNASDINKAITMAYEAGMDQMWYGRLIV